MIGRDRFNPKRRLQPIARTTAQRRSLDALARRVRYDGNPEHKRNPGDFGLTPPSSPRPGKTLCDDANVHSRSEAVALLQAGLRRGLISARPGMTGRRTYGRSQQPESLWRPNSRIRRPAHITAIPCLIMIPFARTCSNGGGRGDCRNVDHPRVGCW